MLEEVNIAFLVAYTRNDLNIQDGSCSVCAFSCIIPEKAKHDKRLLVGSYSHVHAPHA